MHDNTSGSPTAVKDSVTNNGVYGDDDDLISTAVVFLVPLCKAALAAVCAMAWVAAAVTGTVHRVPRYPTLRVDSAAVTMAVARWPLLHNSKPHL